MGQGDVSKLERRTDMYVSTLAGYLQAVGAELEIRAVFPDGRAVKIKQFSQVVCEWPVCHVKFIAVHLVNSSPPDVLLPECVIPPDRFSFQVPRTRR